MTRVPRQPSASQSLASTHRKDVQNRFNACGGLWKLFPRDILIARNFFWALLHVNHQSIAARVAGRRYADSASPPVAGEVAAKLPTPVEGLGLDGNPFDDRQAQYDLTAILRECVRGGWDYKSLQGFLKENWKNEIEGYWENKLKAGPV
jgi:hypothetical protein